jgi:hypothetical protein
MGFIDNLFPDASDGTDEFEHKTHLYVAAIVGAALVFLYGLPKGLGKGVVV